MDSHFEIAVRPQDHPLRHLKEFIPTSHQYIAGAVSGDLLRFTPATDAPPVDVLMAKGTLTRSICSNQACLPSSLKFRDLFLGGNIADCYARTGDPLTL